MTLSEYRNSSSWQGAIELGPHLMRLAEELPGSEEMGLSLQLRQLMVEVPAAVAGDLVQGTSSRHPAGFRLLTTLELIDRVYPALDTAGVRADAEKLVARFMSTEQFAAGPAPAKPAATEAAPVPADVPVMAPEPAPTHVEVSVSPDGNITPASPGLSTAAAQSTSEENHVHPNSVQ